MLVVTRTEGKSILIGDDVKVTVVGIKGGQVRVGIRAPDHVVILQEELIRLCQIPLFVNSLSRCLFSVLRLDGCLTFSMSFLHLPDNLSMRHIASWQKGTQE